MPQEPITYKEFSAKIKEKYPQYKDVDDRTLAEKMVEKYPQYEGKFTFNESSVEGEDVNFPNGSKEPQEQPTTTSSTQDLSELSEGGGGDKFEFKLPKLGTENKSATQLKLEQSREQQDKTGEFMASEYDKMPEIAKIKVQEEQVDSYVNNAQAFVDKDLERLKKIEKEFEILSGEAQPTSEVNPPQTQEYVDSLSKEYEDLNRNIVAVTANIASANSKKGTTLGALQNSIVNGYTSTLQGVADIAFASLAAVNPELAGSPDRNQALKNAREASNSLGVKDILDLELKDKDTTEEYLQSVKSKSLVHQGVLGAAESLFPMMTSYGVGFFPQAYNSALEEVSDKDGLSEEEKALYAMTNASVNMALEKVGMSAIMKGTPAITKRVAKTLTNKVMQGAEKDATREGLKQALNLEVSNFRLGLEKGGGRFVNSFLAEAETGGLQDLSETGIKTLVNINKDQPIFEVPKDIDEVISNTINASIAEGIGGVAFGGVPSVAAGISAGKRDALGTLDKQQFEDLSKKLKDPTFTTAIKENLQAQLNLGADADKVSATLKAINEVADAVKSLPENTPNKAKVADLLIEKNRLELEAENAPDKTLYNDLISDVKGQIKELTRPIEGETPAETTKENKTTVEQYGDKQEIVSKETPVKEDTSNVLKEGRVKITKDGDTYIAKTGEKDIGYFEVFHFSDNEFGISPEVERGMGKEVYLKAAALFPNKSLISMPVNSGSLSQEAENMWESLVRRGLATKKNTGDTQYFSLNKTADTTSKEESKVQPDVASTKPTEKVDTIKAAKDNLSSVWQEWKTSQKNLGIAYDPKSSATMDVKLTKAIIDYLKAVGAKTVNDVISSVKSFSEGAINLDNGSAKVLLDKSTEKEKNRQSFTEAMKSVFGLSDTKAKSAATVADVLVKKMAERLGISKEQMYQKINFQKSTTEAIKKLSNSGKALFQIVGENARLSQVIKDNLSTAREMTKQGKDSKVVKRATGWEQGVDGKWRYETVDNIPFLKDTVRSINTFIVEEGLDNGTGILGGKGELILPPELLKLYPQLKDVEIFFDRKMSEYEGAFYPEKNKIVVGLGVKPENTVKVLLHEVQHAIQKIEGFAKGGDVNVTRTSGMIFSNIPTLKTLRDRVKTSEAKELITAQIDNINKRNQLEERKAKLRDESSKLSFRDNRQKKREIREAIADLSGELSKIKVKSISNLKQELSTLEPNLGEKIYTKLAGEIEARNVEDRRNMTAEQRRDTMLSETENIGRDEQVVLFQGARGAMLAEDGNYIVYALTDPNISTPLHELAHVYEHYLTDSERNQIERWSGHKAGTVEFSEAFARGFEKFLAEGKVTNPKLKEIFENFKEWLTEIYNGIKDSEIDVQLNDEMKAIYNEMLSPQKTSKTVTSETEGLTEKERNKQGFVEYTEAMKEKSAVKLKAVTDSYKAKLKEAKQKTKDIVGQKDLLVGFANDLIKGLKQNGVKEISTAKVTTILNQVKKSNTQASVDKAANKLIEIAQGIEESFKKKEKANIFKKIKDVVSKGAARNIVGGKPKGKSTDAVGQGFFKQIKRVLSAIDSDTLAKIKEELDTKEGELYDALLKSDSELTKSERDLIDLAFAYDTFSNYDNLSIEEATNLLKGLQDSKRESISRSKASREARAQEYKKINKEYDSFIEDNYGSDLYDENGKLQTTTSRNQKRREALRLADKLKLTPIIKEYISAFKVALTAPRLRFLLNPETILTILDKGTGFFVNSIKKPLDRMTTDKLRGVQKQRKVLDSLAKESVKGVKSFEELIRNLLNEKILVALDNGKMFETTKLEALRIYALSLNSTQKEKLVSKGMLDEESLIDITASLSEEERSFVDSVVEYLSDSYYDTVNKVFEDVNGTSLTKIENYFPVTVERQTGSGINLEDGNFSNLFNAQTQSALKDRNDKSTPIVLTETGLDFASALESHFEEMEHFKAYAKGVKKLDIIFKNAAFSELTDLLGVKATLKNLINYSVNQSAYIPETPSAYNKWLSNFTGFVLSFKPIQVVKQSTSLVNAWSDYSLRGEGKRNPALDMVGFAFDVGKMWVNFRSEIKEAKEISPDFKERVENSNLVELYQGTKSSKSKQSTNKFKNFGNWFTFAGDIIGVMGYKAVYNRDIANGMSKEDAAEKFNDYNSTQQSRRPQDLSSVQVYRNFIMRTITSFQSTSILLFNKAYSSGVIFTRDAQRGKFNTKASRDFILAYGAANTLFTAASNIFRLAFGDEEDEEEVYNELIKAATGVKLISSIPLVGSGIEEMVDRYAFDKKAWSSRGGVNPFDRLLRQVIQYTSKNDKAWEDHFDMFNIAQGQLTGVNESFLKGLYKMIDSSEDTLDGFMDFFGVAKSYRPDEEKPSKSTTPTKNPSKIKTLNTRPKERTKELSVRRLKTKN